MYYTIKPNSRAHCLSRIEAARKVTAPLHWYGSDGEGRHKVRVIGPMDSRNDLLGAFRDARPVHEVMRAAERRGEVYARNIHNGWYTDPDGMSCKDGTGLCRGMVAYVGHGRWLAGYEHGGTDAGAVYHLDTFYDSELEAARAADSIAESVADKEREYQERWRAAQELQDRIDENLRCVEVEFPFRHGKHKGKPQRDYIRQWIESIRADREELARDYKDVL